MLAQYEFLFQNPNHGVLVLGLRRSMCEEIAVVEYLSEDKNVKETGQYCILL